MTDSTSTEKTTTKKSTTKKTASRPLTPSAAAARQRPPADRKPKKSAQPTPARSTRREMDVSVNRETVDVGIDFRPIPVRFGPGDEHLWHFNPDPEVDQWGAVQAAIAQFEGREKDISFDEVGALVHDVRSALAGMLAYPDTDGEAFMAEKRYGPMTLVKVAQRVMEEVTGFPTGA